MAYLLDTNILSELIKPQPNQAVTDWIDQQLQSTLFTSAITASELLYGVIRLPDGKRKKLFQAEISAMLEYDFNQRILPFTSETAKHYAVIVNERTIQGLNAHHADAQIASIAMEHGLILVTRNIKDFSHIAGLNVFNPFES